MTDKQQQSGRPSRFAYGKQSGAGSLATFTDIWNADSFDITVNANVEHYETLNGQLFAISESREGIESLSWKGAGPLRGRQAIGLVVAHLGNDILSSAGASVNTTALAANVVIGDTSVTLVGPIPAPPTGIADWVGAPLTLGTGGGAEDVIILAQPDTTHFKISAARKAHTSADTTAIFKCHCVQPNTGANLALLSYYSLLGQWAAITEQQALDALVSSMDVTSDSKNWKLSLGGEMNSNLAYDGDITTTVTPSATELADRPFKAQDTQFFTLGAAADTVVVPHKRFTALSYKRQYAMQQVTEGGNPQAVVQNIVGKASATITWTDDSGEGGFKTFKQDYVDGGKTTPAIIGMINKVTADYFSIVAPLCSADMYNPVGPTDKVVERSGQLTVMLDVAGTGLDTRVWIKSPVVTAY